jgi:hypothetical protein
MVINHQQNATLTLGPQEKGTIPYKCTISSHKHAMPTYAELQTVYNVLHAEPSGNGIICTVYIEILQDTNT